MTDKADNSQAAAGVFRNSKVIVIRSISSRQYIYRRKNQPCIGSLYVYIHNAYIGVLGWFFRSREHNFMVI